MVKKDEGSFLGGFFNNPGTVAIALVLGGLFIFRKQISEAVGGLFDPTGPIADAGAAAGQFVFNIGQDVGGAVFDAGAAAGQSVFDAGAATGQFFADTQAKIDQQLQNFFKVQQSNFEIFTSNFQKDVQEVITDPALKAAEEGGPLGSIFDLFNNFFNPQQVPFQGPNIIPSTGESTFLDPDRPLDLFQFAKKFDIEPQEAFKIQKTFGGLDFEAIAAIPTFGEILAQNPDLTASQIANLKFIQGGGDISSGFDFGTNTGEALEAAQLSFPKQIQDIELQKAIEAFKASFSPVFEGTNNFANPGFPITTGEAILGKSGDVVSASLFPLTIEQQKDFLAGEGFF